MALYYLDTSALVKLYIVEQGSDRVLALADRFSRNQLAILSLAVVEFRSAIRRRERNGDLAANVANEVLETFRRHLETRFAAQHVTDYVLDTACRLVDRHCLRAGDAVQLAGYVILRRSALPDVPLFVCSDRELLAAAAQEGAPVFDPCS